MLFPQVRALRTDPVARGFVMTLFATLLLTGCRGGTEDAAPEESTGVPVAQDPGPVHVHGLGYDASIETLYIATHTGLFELAPDADKARRIGASHSSTRATTASASGSPPSLQEVSTTAHSTTRDTLSPRWPWPLALHSNGSAHRWDTRT